VFTADNKYKIKWSPEKGCKDAAVSEKYNVQ